VLTAEHAFRALPVNTRQAPEMHYALCVLLAHIQKQLAPLQMYVSAVLLARIRIPRALNKQTAYVTQAHTVQMEEHVSNVLQENTNWNLDGANAYYVE